MSVQANTFGLYDKLKQIRITTGEVDEVLLSELLDNIIMELRSKKSSEFLDRLYTACMQYAFLPENNRKTMTEIRVKTDALGICGTDAMLIFEMLSARIQNADCEATEEYKKNVSRLFSSYTMSPLAVRNRLSRTIEEINVHLRQQIALAHFGMKSRFYSPDKQTAADIININIKEEAKAIADEVGGVDDGAKIEERIAQRLVAVLKLTREKCDDMLNTADRQAELIVEKARARARVLAMESRSEMNESIKGILLSLSETNKAVMDIQGRTDQMNINKFARDLTELYNLIADNYDSLSKAKGRDEEETRILKNNYEAFLGMIEDILTKYGISTIKTKSGEKFDGRLHDVKGRENFNPKSAVIKESLRSGFMSDMVVIQKERVIIEA